MEEVTIKIGGEAGFGIKVSGIILGRALFRAGLFVFGYSEYPSLVRGGHNTYQLNISPVYVGSPTEGVDILVALNQDTVDQDVKYVKAGGLVIGDRLEVARVNGIAVIDLPLMKLAEKAGGAFMRNMVAMGALMNLLGFKLDGLNQEIRSAFSGKGKRLVALNIKAAQSGYASIKPGLKQFQNQAFKAKVETPRPGQNDKLWTANEAAAAAIIQAGCRFYAAYPMTPATSIMHILAEKQRQCALVMHQTEDEISAIGAALGASAAGVRAATGTSGGGFALMSENLGFAGMAEIPLVLVESQRTAPASGMPTWTEQADLQFALRASHGEFPRIVMAPGDAAEAFYLLQEAFNWADKFQLPVVFLMDKLLAESDFSCCALDQFKISIKREGLLTDAALLKLKDYKRYEFTQSGLSKRALPGQARGVHLINSDEHDEHGFSTEESATRIRSMDKRFRKLKLMASELPEPVLYGPAAADLTLVSWGSTKGVVLDTLNELGVKHPKLRVNFLHLNILWPFSAQRVKAVLAQAKKVLLVENNKTGQLADLIQQEAGIDIKHKFLKYDGRPFFREEIINKINALTP